MIRACFRLIVMSSHQFLESEMSLVHDSFDEKTAITSFSQSFHCLYVPQSTELFLGSASVDMELSMEVPTIHLYM